MSAERVDIQTAELPLIVYRPVKRRLRIRELYTTLPVARMIGLRDIKAKYKQAALGPLWLLIGPLGMLLAITVAFSGVTSVKTGGVPYLLFALTGLLVWTFIQLSTMLGSQAIVANGPLVRRSPLPRIALITGSVLGNLPPVAIMFVIAVVATLVTRGFAVQVLLLPLLIVWLFVFSVSTAMLLGALAARFRDIVSVLPLIIQAGIFVSPVGYSIAGSPKNIHTLLTVNPVSGLIEAWRWSLLNVPNPDWTVMGIAAAWTVMIALVAWRVFSRLEVDFADFV
jgi:lipopolysaccharide transport system permease protein